MELKHKIRTVLRESYGEFDTYLEHKYQEKITETLEIGDWKLKRAWAVYNQVIIELKTNLKDHVRVKELQYRLTERVVGQPNEICIEVIQDVKDKSPELQRLYDKLKNIA